MERAGLPLSPCQAHSLSRGGHLFQPGPRVWAPSQHLHLLICDWSVDLCKLLSGVGCSFRGVGSPGAGQRTSSSTAGTWGLSSPGSAGRIARVQCLWTMPHHHGSGLLGGWPWPCAWVILYYSCFFTAENPKGLSLPAWPSGVRAKPSLSSAPQMLSPRPVAGGVGRHCPGPALSRAAARARPGPCC